MKSLMPWPGIEPGFPDCRSGVLTTTLPRHSELCFSKSYQIFSSSLLNKENEVKLFYNPFFDILKLCWLYLSKDIASIDQLKLPYFNKQD